MKKVLILALILNLIQLSSYAQKTSDELNIENKQLTNELEILQQKIKELTTNLDTVSKTLNQIISKHKREEALPIDVLTLQEELRKARSIAKEETKRAEKYLVQTKKCREMAERGLSEAIRQAKIAREENDRAREENNRAREQMLAMEKENAKLKKQLKECKN
ncbi:MAG: hypothetical protein ACPG19_15065 [Saprospiraceae bacterium]